MLDYLPKEVLIPIFSYLPLDVRFLTLTEVSTSFDWMFEIPCLWKTLSFCNISTGEKKLPQTALVKCKDGIIRVKDYVVNLELNPEQFLSIHEYIGEFPHLKSLKIYLRIPDVETAKQTKILFDKIVNTYPKLEDLHLDLNEHFYYPEYCEMAFTYFKTLSKLSLKRIALVGKDLEDRFYDFEEAIYDFFSTQTDLEELKLDCKGCQSGLHEISPGLIKRVLKKCSKLKTLTSRPFYSTIFGWCKKTLPLENLSYIGLRGTSRQEYGYNGEAKANTELHKLLPVVTNCPKLKQLKYEDATTYGLLELSKYCSNLEKLTVEMYNQEEANTISEGMTALIKACPNLQSLTFDMLRNKPISNFANIVVEPFKNLKELKLASGKILNTDLYIIAENCTQLQTAYFSHIGEITLYSVLAMILGSAKYLTDLSFDWCQGEIKYLPELDGVEDIITHDKSQDDCETDIEMILRRRYKERVNKIKENQKKHRLMYLTRLYIETGFLSKICLDAALQIVKICSELEDLTLTLDDFDYSKDTTEDKNNAIVKLKEACPSIKTVELKG